MIWIYLIVQAVGLGIIARSFKAEEQNGYAAIFGMGGLLSLFLVVAVAPLMLKLLTGFLIVLFRSRMSHAFAGGQETILSYFRTSLQVLTALGSTGFDAVSRVMPKPLTRFLSHPIFCWRQAQQKADVPHSNKNIIDVEAIDVSR